MAVTSSVGTKYLFPSTAISIGCVLLKLSSSNFLLRKTRFNSLLESENIVGFIDGTFSMPAQTTFSDDGQSEMENPDYSSWKRFDRKVKGWIVNTLSEDALRLIVGLETALYVWKCLERAYAGDSPAQEFQLLRQLQLFKKEDASSAYYINKFKGICDDLAAIGNPVADQNKVFWLLQGLGPKYESFTTSMLKPPIPSYSDVIPLLHSHEIRNHSHGLSFPNQNVALG